MFSVFRDTLLPTRRGSTAPVQMLTPVSETSGPRAGPSGLWDAVDTFAQENGNQDPRAFFAGSFLNKIDSTGQPAVPHRISSLRSRLSGDFETNEAITHKLKILTRNPAKLHRDTLSRRGRRAVRELQNTDRRISDETINLVMGALACQVSSDYICLTTEWKYIPRGRGTTTNGDLSSHPRLTNSADGETVWVVVPVRYPSAMGPRWTLAVIDPFHQVAYAYDPVRDLPRANIQRISLENLIKVELGVPYVEIRTIEGPEVQPSGADHGVTHILSAAQAILSPHNTTRHNHNRQQQPHAIQRTQKLTLGGGVPGAATPKKLRSRLLRLVSQHYQIDERDGTPVLRNLLMHHQQSQQSLENIQNNKPPKKESSSSKRAAIGGGDNRKNIKKHKKTTTNHNNNNNTTASTTSSLTDDNQLNPNLRDADSLLRKIRRLGSEADALMKEAEEKTDQAARRYQLVDTLLEDAEAAARRAREGGEPPDW